MKRVLILLICMAGLIPVIDAQITRGTAVASKTVSSVSTSSLAGTWNGTQTDMTGLYPQAISFQLTNNGEFFMGNSQNGIYPVKGTYTISGNSITGNYKQASSGEMFSFTATYDATSQKLTGTTGAGTNITGNGKWTAEKLATLNPQNQLSTIKKTTTTTTGSAPAPPPAPTGAPASIAGKWRGAFRFGAGSNSSIDYGMEFISPKRMNIIDYRMDPAWEDNRISTSGEFGYSNGHVAGTFYFKNEPSVWYSYTGTVSGNRLSGTFGQGENTTGTGSFELTYQQPPAATSANTNNSGGGVPDTPGCEGTVGTEYYLVDAKLRFYTGNDSKEAPSVVTAALWIPQGSRYSTTPNETSAMIFSNDDVSQKSKFEFRANSTTDLPLTAISSPCINGAVGYRPANVSLGVINTYGLRLQVFYNPNFFTDAWKLDKVELLLQFKRPDGTPHPSLGNKVVTFTSSSALLTGSNPKLVFTIDKFLIGQ